MGKYENRLNQNSIPMADEILSLVNNLPAAGGGEDLQSTVAEQTAAVTTLLAMVNRKVAENRGEGEYVWKKLTAPVTITMTQQNNGTTPTTFKMASADVDLSAVDISYFVGITGEYAVSGSTAPFEIKEDGLYMGSSLRGALTYNPSTQVLSCAGNIGSLCTWTVETQQNFIDYVVSSDAKAYPNGGEQDGYWYELVEEGVNLLTLFGCTKMAIDEFVYSSATGCDDVIVNHSLRAVPKVIIIASLDKPTKNYDMTLTLAVHNSESGSTESYSSVSQYIMSSKLTSTTGGFSAYDTYFKIQNASPNYGAGMYYKLITMA